jgi:hypothetical protein
VYTVIERQEETSAKNGEQLKNMRSAKIQQFGMRIIM